MAVPADSQADNVLGPKANQPALYEDVTTFFERPPANTVFEHDEQVDKGHGRLEIRQARTLLQVLQALI